LSSRKEETKLFAKYYILLLLLMINDKDHPVCNSSSIFVEKRNKGVKENTNRFYFRDRNKMLPGAMAIRAGAYFRSMTP